MYFRGARLVAMLFLMMMMMIVSLWCFVELLHITSRTYGEMYCVFCISVWACEHRSLFIVRAELLTWIHISHTYVLLRFVVGKYSVKKNICKFNKPCMHSRTSHLYPVHILLPNLLALSLSFFLNLYKCILLAYFLNMYM